MENYYTKIADRYRSLRTTDSEPVDFVCDLLSGLPRIEAGDMGCGEGRYAKLFLDSLGEKLFMHCFDTNEYMLNQLESYLKEEGISNFSAKVADAREVPLPTGTLDSVLCFNSLHHIGLVGLLSEISRILKPGGSVFIYTRSRSQNARTVWCRHFPLFQRKESRLYEPEEFKFKVEKFPEFEIEQIKTFSYKRNDSQQALAEKSSGLHYSTFYFYEPEELERASGRFAENLKKCFGEDGNVEWEDEKTMYVLRKRA